ncbi:MAG: hemolysin III family protein [Tissierellales bacterium]|jgi:hemolysin III|nr:hemolysin III family protein [Tissierellales bacterium]
MREPISTITHFIGAILSVFGLIYLIYKGYVSGSMVYLVSFIIFGVSMVLLYAASTTYHWIKVRENIVRTFRKIDHMMIFVLISGTYTPICLAVLRSTLGYVILSIVWGLTIVGIFLKIFWIDMPRRITAAIYLAMGWLSMILIYQLVKIMPMQSFVLLILGGISYTLGGIIYGGKISIFNFKGFGFHEIFHLFVLGGSAFHYFMVVTLV